MDSKKVIVSYFAAMRRGATAESDLVSLFDEEAVYDEPFSGRSPAVGIDAIRERFRLGWETPLPEMELDVLMVTVDGREGLSRWECRSPALPGPVRGEDAYEIVDGRIKRLVVKIDRD